MNILAHIHAYVPEHNAGAEHMTHSILRWFVQQGHGCHVLTNTNADYEYEGVRVYKDTFINCEREWKWCDIGMTHLARTGKAWNWAQYVNKPILFTAHNNFTNRIVELKNNFAIIYNTDWIEKFSKAKGFKHKSIVVHPPVWFDDYDLKPSTRQRKYITLINCWGRKGGKVLIDLAKQMPDRKFLGVMGGYGEQLKADLPNLTYIDNTINIRDDVYAKTKILLMPSVYESYGRTAVEAMCSGIPVIASATPGLKESLDDCGLFTAEVQDEKFLKWQPFAEHIKSLDDKDLYETISTKSKARAKELDKRNISEMLKLEQFMESLITG